MRLHPLKLSGDETDHRGHAGVKQWFAELAAFDHGHRVIVSEIEPSANGACSQSDASNSMARL